MSVFPARPLLAACAGFCAAFCSIPALAFDDPIATDRPDFVESSAVVGKGRLQIESSVALERDRRAGARQTVWATPTLVRIGVTDNIELRVESDGATRQRNSAAGAASTERGFADSSLGLKWHAADAAGPMPSMALLLHADLSTGSAAFREPGTRPSARLVAEWELPNDISFGLMPGIGYQRDSGGHAYGMLGIVAGKAFSERLRGFAELSSPHIAKSRKGGTPASLMVGAAYLVQRNLQVDAALSRGLNRHTPDLSLTIGLSIKL